MKNLANCTPTEFLKQSMIVKEPLERWFKETGIPEIRKRKPEGFDGMTREEQEAAILAQGEQNIADMLMSALEKDMDGTLEVMALLCFTDPKDVDTHPMGEYISAVLEMMADRGVRSFFTFFLKAGRPAISEE